MSQNATGIVEIGLYVTEERLQRAKQLMKEGLVHVTGLPTINWCDDARKACDEAVTRALAKHGIGSAESVPNISLIGQTDYVIQARRSELNHADYNNGKVVIVTEDGEVWIGTKPHHMKNRLRGAFVPCSNGEQIEMHLLLERIADPYSDCHWHHSPIPQIRD